MNCYTDENGTKYYCLNPINSNYIYSCAFSNGIEFLICLKSNYRNPFHRMDGPAIEYIHGLKQWFYHGKQIICKNNKEFLKIIKMKAFI